MANARWNSADLARRDNAPKIPAKPPPRQATAPPAPITPTAPPASPEQPETKLTGKKLSVGEVAVLLARSPVRWYACSAQDAGLLQVKFAGVPAERLHELIHAATQLFPELRQY